MEKAWYGYLKHQGFEDIEKGIRLVRPTEELSLRIDFKSQLTFEAKLTYYQWAGECLQTNSFDSQIDRIIWEFHSEGYKAQEISPLIGKERSTINKRLKIIASKLKRK